MLRIEREDSGREILVATTDIKPGTLLFSEAPVVTVYFHCPELEQGYNIAQQGLLPMDMCNGFKNASPAQQEKFLQLYSPKDLLLEWVFRNNLETAPDAPEWMPNLDLWIKVSSIYFNNYYHRGNGGPVGSAATAVYEMMSKVKHSCVENVVRVPDGEENYACRAICHIKAGEPLTISHVDDRAMETTAWRRYSCMQLKNFTCHCPRCDAEGDDTRQFDCFDPTCDGSHMMHEPLSKQQLPVPGQEYEGVTYEEPRMLPCTVCHRSPPAEYVQRMLEWEKSVYKLIHTAYWQGYEARKQGNGRAVGDQVHALLDVTPPRRHSMAHDLAYTRGRLFNLKVPSCMSRLTAALRSEAADLHAVRVVEGILPGAHPEVYKHLRVLAGAARFSHEATKKKERLQKYLRVSLIHHGRGCREATIDTALAAALAALPQMAVQNISVCAFCEESPDNAELKLSRCGACKKVAYCSKGCQKAHWNVHKLHCAKK